MSQTKRIAIGSILTESNLLGGVPIDMDWFERYELYRGEAILQIDTGAVGGMLAVLRQHRAEPVPLLYASTCPGGPLTSECYARLKGELIERLQQALPVDGVLLPLHGAAAVEDIGDLEGDLIKAVRQVVGETVPIVATLDLHTHVTADMVHNADGLVAWETYPHRDAVSTGERGARLLMDTLEGRCRPTMAMAKVPVITSAIHGSTEGDDPFAHIMRRAKAFEARAAVLSTSAILVHCVLDQPGMGSGALVITDDDRALAVELASELARDFWARRFDLEPQVHPPEEAIARGLATEGPVVLVETADCCGGGAAGDSVHTLKALIDAGVQQTALVPVVDPDAAAACHAAGVGGELNLEIGHRNDPRWGQPIALAGRVARLGDGRFHYTGGIWGGVEGEMGPSAVLEIGAVQVLISSFATYDWADEQFRALQMDPATAKFIVAKNPMNYRMAYGGLEPAVFILDTPGPTPPTMRHARFTRLERPYFPLDEEIPGLEPTVLQ